MASEPPPLVWAGFADCGCPRAVVLASCFSPKDPSFDDLETLDHVGPMAFWVLTTAGRVSVPMSHDICRRTEPFGVEAVELYIPPPSGCSPSCSEGHTYLPPCELAPSQPDGYGALGDRLREARGENRNAKASVADIIDAPRPSEDPMPNVRPGDLMFEQLEEDGTYVLQLVDHLGNRWLVSARPTGGGLHIELAQPGDPEDILGPDPGICYTAGQTFVDVHRG